VFFVRRGERKRVFFFEMGKRRGFGRRKGKAERPDSRPSQTRCGTTAGAASWAGPGKLRFTFFSLKSFRFEECLKFKNVQIQRYLNLKILNLKVF
jgi:hypothetical protein